MQVKSAAHAQLEAALAVKDAISALSKAAEKELAVRKVIEFFSVRERER
jgi:hypothetical protein